MEEVRQKFQRFRGSEALAGATQALEAEWQQLRAFRTALYDRSSVATGFTRPLAASCSDGGGGDDAIKGGGGAEEGEGEEGRPQKRRRIEEQEQQPGREGEGQGEGCSDAECEIKLLPGPPQDPVGSEGGKGAGSPVGRDQEGCHKRVGGLDGAQPASHAAAGPAGTEDLRAEAHAQARLVTSRSILKGRSAVHASCAPLPRDGKASARVTFPETLERGPTGAYR